MNPLLLLQLINGTKKSRNQNLHFQITIIIRWGLKPGYSKFYLCKSLEVKQFKGIFSIVKTNQSFLIVGRKTDHYSNEKTKHRYTCNYKNKQLSISPGQNQSPVTDCTCAMYLNYLCLPIPMDDQSKAAIDVSPGTCDD